MEKALLVTVKLKSERDSWRLEDIAEELEELVATCGVVAVDNITCICEKATANFFIGSGKAQEIALLCQEQDVNAVIFSHNLSGTQQRNLEELTRKKIVDRTQLILHIFAKHAKSMEGKMQVELAQLEYLLPRLVGKGHILSRQGGGIGTSGPGETRLEVDRRRIRKRIDKLKDDLAGVSVHRVTLRKKREDKATPTLALVGYTNAGKSTLLNALTSAGQAVADSLFTTLDPLSKGLVLPNGEHVIISDTVGFLHDLPHHLIEAFKATLEEVVNADLLVHVLDVNHPLLYECSKSVFSVLKELGADEKPMITALNKIDLLDDLAWLERLKVDFINPIPISAKSGKNLDLLLEKIQAQFISKMVNLKLRIPHSRMDIVNMLYSQGKVSQIKYLDRGIEVKVSLSVILSQKLLNNKEIKDIS